MKSKSKIALLLSGMLVLSACSPQTSKTVATINSEEITANALYDELIQSTTGKSVIYQNMIKEIVVANYPATDAMKTEADITIESIQKQYQAQYGSEADAALQDALTQSGFKDLEEYREILVYSFQLKEFLNKYIDDHFDEVFNDYYTTQNPRYVSHVLIKMEDPENPTDEEKAKVEAVQQAINNNEDFAEIAKKYSDDTSASNGGYLGICDKKTNFVEPFLKAALSLDEGKISDAVKSDYGVHFIKVDSRDQEKMKQDAQVLDERLPSYDSLMVHAAISTYDVKITDEQLKEIFESQLKSYLNQRENSGKENA